MIKRGLSVLLVLIFVFSVVPFTAAPVSAAEDFPDYAPEGMYTEGLGITEEQYRALRTRLCSAARACSPSCDISDLGYYYSGNTGSLIAHLIYDFDPESFHVTGVSFSMNSSGKIFSVIISYNCTAEEYASKRAEMIASADELLSGIEGNDSLTELQKALLIHDRLAVLCAYNVDNYYSGTFDKDDYGAYGALVKRTAMCEGYSKAYCYLLNRVGIRSSLTDSETLGHMWNVVWIYGEKYHVDVTWDDSTPNKQGHVRHVYFLRSTAKFKELKHNASDFDESPVSDRYDGDQVWTAGETQAVICGGNIYFMNGPDLCRLIGDDSFETIENFSAKWRASANSYYTGSYQRLATDGNYLFISLPSEIVRYDPSSGERVTAYEYSGGNYWYIYGMTYRDGLFYIDPFNSANFQNDTEKLYGFTAPYAAPAPHEHVEGVPVTENVIEATCEAAGSYDKVIYCAECGAEMSRVVIITPALGHDFVEYRIEPTCTYDGLYETKCARCGKTGTSVVIPARHNFGDAEVTLPTCTEEGATERTCSVCGYVERTEIKPALGHDFSEEFTVDREPTYTEEGEMSRHCSRCRERTDITPIPKLDGVPGDVNGDGDVTMKDVLLMRRYIAGLDDLTDAQIALGDMNGDGDVNMKDVLRARRIIAGLD